MVGATSYAISGSGLNKLFVTAEVSEESLLAKAPQKKIDVIFAWRPQISNELFFNWKQ